MSETKTHTADSISYESIKYKHPIYRHRHLNPREGRTLDIPIREVISSTFEIPSGVVFNFSESYLSFTYTVKEIIQRYNCTFEDTYGMINAIKVYDESGTYLCDLNHAQNYIKSIGKKEISMTELLCRDSGTNQIYPSNELRDSASNPRPDGYNTTVSYLEPKYLRVGEAGDSTDVGDLVKHLNVPLSDFANTILAMNKSLYLPKKLIFEVVWGPVRKMGFITDTYPLDTIFGLYDDFNHPIEVKDLSFMLAVDENQENITKLSKWVNSPTSSIFKIAIPYVTAYMFKKEGVQQAIELKLTKDNGNRLQKVIYSPYYSERNGDIYNCENVGGEKVRSYQTFINDISRQDFFVRCTNPYYEDYAVNKYLMKGSSLLNREVYQYNWFHCDDFTGGIKSNFSDNCSDCDQKNYKLDGENYLVGLPIGKGLVWRIEATINSAFSDLNNYVWVVTQKELICHGTDLKVL